MKKSNYQWQLQTKTELPVEFIEQLKKEQINPLIGQLLWHRNIRTEEALRKFLHPTIEDIYDPFLMHDMEKAVARISKPSKRVNKSLSMGIMMQMASLVPRL